ncbi:extra-large guanine nucleotide-binding protein 1-like [Rosa rugosa]|uniref:extra-large guanine nucleotide-binding protein 1-like n=1 Tax=Rosa rugosa TaxID=74645 RepID=UPI002B4020E1|nr:extra-large guanine nucleotide-binding protein 1-like [Rosa rugosa]
MAAAVMRKLSAALASKGADFDVESYEDLSAELEYSFAVEYQGPPVGYEIPHAFPIDIHRIPTAAPVSSPALLHNLSLPIIQPIAKSSQSRKVRVESKLGDEVKAVLDSGEEKGVCSEVGSSGELGCGKLEGEVELGEDGGEGDWGSTDSGLSSRSVSSEVFSGREEAGVDEIVPHHVKRPSTVTFRDPDSNDIVVQEAEFNASDGDESLQVRPRVERNGKKGSCYRCGRGNKFTEKEVCIVCGAKYCFDCVLRAMGSMPEGRKCVTCIRFGIDESRRGSIGKSSRMLWRLLTKAQVEVVMKAEISCQANQLPGNLVFVNDEPLTQEELSRLQGCRNPPKNLKPGSYWYDNVSGFWGKVGRRPCQVISPQLNVGGHLRENASNGDTKIMINGRVITKLEVFMLQMAGVPCEGKLNYWVNADGSYQEEGMNNVKGKIWDTKIKLVCTILSLPIPSEPTIPPPAEEDRNFIEEKLLDKLVLVGYHKSGSSTIFKQAKFLYNVPFCEDERQNIKFMIQSRLYSYLGILLEGREWFEEESLVENRKGELRDEPGPSGITSQLDSKTTYTIGPRLKSFADWLLKNMISGTLEAIFPAATREYAPFVEELWNDPAIQATYNRRNELEMLPRQATYFLNRAVEISRTDYEPSDMDILYAEGITSSNSLNTMEFSLTRSSQRSDLDSIYQLNPSQRYQLIRVHSLGGSCKLLEMFEDVDMVIFCVALTDYDEFCEDASGVSINKMMASKQLFESIATHPAFDQKHFLLILNKFDLLEEKIDQVSLTRCEWFNDFNPATSHNPNSSNNNSNNPTLAHRAFQYIAMKFKRLFHTQTDRKLFVSQVTALEPDTVDEALRYASEILRCEEEVPRLINEFSSASIDASSTV